MVVERLLLCYFLKVLFPIVSRQTITNETRENKVTVDDVILLFLQWSPIGKNKPIRNDKVYVIVYLR